MAISITTPVTGGTQTGFTTPSFTIATDTSPAPNAKQYVVTANTGATGADSHTVSKPFTVTIFRPLTLRSLPSAIPATGVIPVNKIGFNKYLIKVRKGALPAPNQIPQVNTCDIVFNVAAGTDTQESANVRALASVAVGVLNQVSAGIGDTLVTGAL